ncbi:MULTISPECIES: anti-sigma factor domain-containing protein [unclassified Streptomyces]|uniref:anti-sigma factor n=1 Tax=unclassified Streptomyces TaxID=2593676 RepID=UPI00365AD4DF
MNSADLHTLTGAYVLHALAPDEEAEFEQHLRACPPCSLEVRELAATAGRLGSAEYVTPPPELKHQVMARVGAERQDRPRVTRQAHRGVVRRGRAVSRFALAACMAVAASLGGAAVWQHDRAEDARAQAQRAERTATELAAVLAAPDAKVSTGPLTDGATGTVVVSRSRNRAAFYASGMPKPPQGKVYQLWFEDGGTMRSAGLMELTATSGAVLMEGPVNSASGMGVTVEPAGGSRRPSSAPLALMRLPS